VITRADGSLQTTYKGWPLYYFSKDAGPGDLKGENVQGN
jgi:predicted lipoprotein with Yx(FWY)xxD motif